MSSSKEFVAEVLEQLAPLAVRARAMFGEYAVYCDEKVVILICDDRVFLKPTPAAVGVASELEWCPPYPGAKEHLLLDDAFRRDRPRLRRLVRATADQRPDPKPRRKRKARARRKP